MLTITKYDGTILTTLHNLSEELYELTEDRKLMGKIVSGYTKGTRVRLIDGVDGSSELGYHFDSQYSTVCRVDAREAEFIGVEKSQLKLVK